MSVRDASAGTGVVRPSTETARETGVVRASGSTAHALTVTVGPAAVRASKFPRGRTGRSAGSDDTWTTAAVADTVWTVTMKSSAGDTRTSAPTGRAIDQSPFHPAAGEGVGSSSSDVSDPLLARRSSTPCWRP